jgi:hypothetical protein
MILTKIPSLLERLRTLNIRDPRLTSFPDELQHLTRASLFLMHDMRSGQVIANHSRDRALYGRKSQFYMFRSSSHLRYLSYPCLSYAYSASVQCTDEARGDHGVMCMSYSSVAGTPLTWDIGGLCYTSTHIWRRCRVVALETA